MRHIISFNTQGYDPFIDFLKAYAILCVLLGHTFPYLDKIGYGVWAGMQVPIFILIQAFHALKKDSPKLNFTNIIKRIFIPFAITTSITIAIIFALKMIGGGYELNFNVLCARGGVGPGCYYPWIFLQIAILLPLIRPLLDKGSRLQQIIIAIVVCEIFEIAESMIGIPEHIYRLIAVRYFFLIYLAWIWIKDGIVLNAKTFAFSFISLMFIIYFEYFSINDEPWFFSTSWKFHRWPCYYYVSTLLCYVLYCVYKHVSKIRIFNKATYILAKCSYEIFLIQMAMIAIIPNFGMGWMVLIIFSSIIGGYYFNKLYARITANRISVFQ